MAGKIKIVFAPKTPSTSQKLFSLYKNRGKYLKFLPEGGIEADMRGRHWDEVFRELKSIMEELTR